MRPWSLWLLDDHSLLRGHKPPPDPPWGGWLWAAPALLLASLFTWIRVLVWLSPPTFHISLSRAYLHPRLRPISQPAPLSPLPELPPSGHLFPSLPTPDSILSHLLGCNRLLAGLTPRLSSIFHEAAWVIFLNCKSDPISVLLKTLLIAP